MRLPRSLAHHCATFAHHGATLAHRDAAAAVYTRRALPARGGAVWASAAGDGDDEEPLQGAALLIDIAVKGFSVLFLPIILFVFLSISVATGRTGPQRIAADPLDALPSLPPPSRPFSLGVGGGSGGGSLLLLASAARDPVLDELLDSAPARSLSLPPQENSRQVALQDLEDERLERCRSASPNEFDQVLSLRLEVLALNAVLSLNAAFARCLPASVC